MFTIASARYKYPDTGSLTLNCQQIILDWTGCATLNAPSGSGKTTLFRLLSGWYANDKNAVCSIDPAINSFTAIKFVGSHRSLMPWRTIDENVHMLCPKLEHTRLEELLTQVGLSAHVAEMYPYQLSRGMYKRVELIVAVASNPKILLLDEFYSSIDDSQKDLVRKFLIERRSADMTWIIAHEDDLRTWIGGPQYEFILDNKCVTGIKRR